MTRSKFVRAARARPAHAGTTISSVRNSIGADEGSALTSRRRRSRDSQVQVNLGGRPGVLGTRGPIVPGRCRVEILGREGNVAVTCERYNYAPRERMF